MSFLLKEDGDNLLFEDTSYFHLLQESGDELLTEALNTLSTEADFTVVGKIILDEVVVTIEQPVIEFGYDAPRKVQHGATWGSGEWTLPLPVAAGRGRILNRGAGAWTLPLTVVSGRGDVIDWEQEDEEALLLLLDVI